MDIGSGDKCFVSISFLFGLLTKRSNFVEDIMENGITGVWL